MSQPSRLESLPAELRNQIYEYVLGGLQAQFMTGTNANLCLVETRPLNDTGSDIWQRSTSDLLALTAVSRQLHSETRLVPFALNQFCGHVRKFMNAVQGKNFSLEHLKAMREIELVLDADNFLRARIPGTVRADVAPGHDLADLLRLLGEMPSLRQVIVVWEGCSSGHSKWKSLYKYLEHMFEKALEREEGGAGVEIVITAMW